MNAAPEFDVFVSYNTLDHKAVERIAHALKDRELTVFLDRWDLVPGRPWPDALEEHLSRCRSAAVVLGPSGMGAWQQREHYLALDRQAQDSAFGVIPVILPNADPALGFLSLNTWVDLRNGIDNSESIDLLAAAVRGQAPADLLDRTRRAAAEVCPYRGLEVFREEDAPCFFGREDFTESLREAVAAGPLVAVVGASGSGKSSVVRAGLVPSLRRLDGTVWEVVTFLPGDRPVYALSAALLPLLEPEMSERKRLVENGEMADDLAQGRLALRDVVERVVEKQQGTDRLLLVVDQWEELYTYAKDDKAKKTSTRFVDELLAATETAPLTVVLTLRADFYGEILAHRALSDRLQVAQVNLGPMTREELERAVNAPAEKAGLSFDPGLVDRLLDDVGSEPGNLPLLEFSLKELWSARRGSQLLYEVYKTMGGVKGAIAQRAEGVYEALDPGQRSTVERVFTKLVRPGDETGDTRRRAMLQNFDEAGRALVRILAGPVARLLITGRDTGTKQETVEVAHEALIREWDRLRKWADKVRKDLRNEALMEDLAQSWEEHGSGLASRRQLQDFGRVESPSELAESYLKASRRRIRRVWGGGIVGALLVSGGLGGFVWWSDDLGFSANRGAELLLYRAGIYHPAWIPEMVTIEPDSFKMGPPDPNGPNADPDGETDEYPQHKVTFEKGFKLGKYEVTFDQYCASTKRPCPSPKWGRGMQPVINVSWGEANAYAVWLKEIISREYRLPTEAEWEYAARAGTEGRYWWCAEEKPDCDIKPDVANCYGCKSTQGLEGIGAQTLPVGSFTANPFKLYDTAGNVWEWVQDCLHDDYNGPSPVDGTAWEEADGGDCGRRVVRGGSWSDRPWFLRSAARYRNDTDYRSYGLGFRLAQDF